MTTRTFTGLLVLAAIITAVVYLWQPWEPADEPVLRLGLDLQGGLRVVLEAEGPVPERDDLVAARRVIESRVDEFGVAEPLIQTSGDRRIIVELPGLTADEQERALDLIGQQAVLHFRLVRIGATDPLNLNDLEDPAFTGEILSTARTSFDEFNRPEVLFNIRREYASDFGDFTFRNQGRRMAIVLDDEIISAPTIQARITDSGVITGQFTLSEARDLALVLRSGSLPINLQVEEIRAVGPTLGQDSVAAGTRAALIGAALVVIAILAYYGPLFGGALTVGLGLVMLFVFGALAGLGAALTLPGLAGLVLTIGAAVDGNVISFERIKEELREGKSLRLAMRGGFGNSLSAIVDANVTTLLAAAALYQYTTGPVRGFAVTLAIGIAAALFVNTMVVPWLLDVLTTRFKKPRMAKGIYFEGIQFVRRAPKIMAVSGLLALGFLLLVIVKPLNLSTDFTGGTNVLLTVPEELTVAEVRSAIDELGIPGITGSGAMVQEVHDPTLTGQQMSVRVGLTEEREAAGEFPGQLAAALNAEMLQADFVGPAVGEELREAAWYAVLVSLGLILFYVGWRFWPTWIVAVAAIIAVIHDVGIVMGFLDLIGAEFGIPVLAALLFVVGYSLNDSIVIADRMRENLRKVRGKTYEQIIDMSVNQSIARTVVTSFTTLLPVLSLLFFGGSVLRDFSITLLAGVLFGTYSSIFILAPLVVWFKRAQQGRRALKPRPAT